jgi:hypothetical protein
MASGSSVARRVVPVLLAAAVSSACSTRLWRFTPLTESSSSDRLNAWPLAFVDQGGGAVLWPLIDFDDRGFAVRPIVSKDDSEWDVLFPLSHFDVDEGEGWALLGYSYSDNVGFLPICNFGPSLNFVIPAYWYKENGHVVGGGLFPVAGFGDFNYVGTAWWGNFGGTSGHGLLPLYTWSDFKQIGPAYWHEMPGEGVDWWGFFPLIWSFEEGDKLLAVPFWWRDHTEQRQLDALLVPPTWWETSGQLERKFLFPFYAHVADEESDLTAWPPLFARTRRPGSTHWYTLAADGWESGARSGLNVYPLWWSASGPEDSRQMLVPFYYFRERGTARQLITPLGGLGWDASGESSFQNFLGPVYHHTVGPDLESTSVLWPLFQREREGDATTTLAFPFFSWTSDPQRTRAWMAAGLGRYVATDSSSSFRFWPLWSQSHAPETPDLLFDTTIAKHWSYGPEWSDHVFPLYAGRGDAQSSEHSTLLGLARVKTTESGSAWRLWPLASGATDAAAQGWLDRATLFHYETNFPATSDAEASDPIARAWLFPLWYSEREGARSEQKALLIARHATTEQGSAWRLWPLASASTDPHAEGLFDRASLFHHDSTGSASTNWLFPLWYDHQDPNQSSQTALLLARHKSTPAGSAWRLFPLASTTNADGLDDLFDPFTLIGVHPQPGKTHVHVGTSMLFDLDRYGPEKKSWDTRVLTFFDVGHQEPAPPDAGGVKPTDPMEAARSTLLKRDFAGFLFDWFLLEQRKVKTNDGRIADESHYRLPFLHEYERTDDKKEWDVLCWSVHSVETPQEEEFSVLWRAYHKVKHGAEVQRDMFPFITYDTSPTTSRFSFLWHFFDLRRDGERHGGHVLFIPWGDA